VSDLQHDATASYQIPEQVWDVNPPSGSTAGTPTKSMSPLNWSMAMYVQLTAALYNQQHGTTQLPGMPIDVYNHYAATTAEPVTSSPSPAIAGQLVTVVYRGSLASTATAITLHWGHDGWQGVTDTAMAKQSDGSWTATVTVPAGSALNIAVHDQAGTWDNNGGRNYGLAIR
jgi:alpha-glucosidase